TRFRRRRTSQPRKANSRRGWRGPPSLNTVPKQGIETISSSPLEATGEGSSPLAGGVRWTSAFEGSGLTLFDELTGRGALLLFPYLEHGLDWNRPQALSVTLAKRTSSIAP